MARQKNIKIPPSYGKFLMFHSLCSDDIQKEDLEILKHQPRPDMICGEEVPQNLNHLSYGQLDDLRSVNNDEDIPSQLASIIFGKTLAIMDEDVNKVFGFTNFCTEELKRINNIFSSINTKHSPEEISAGVDTLNFGSFGVLDWYAKRMGIVNQNDVRDVSWVRIFQCMKNDHLQAEYEKRLQEVYMKPHRGK